jgi:hypothetical protein
MDRALTGSARYYIGGRQSAGGSSISGTTTPSREAFEGLHSTGITGSDSEAAREPQRLSLSDGSLLI